MLSSCRVSSRAPANKAKDFKGVPGVRGWDSPHLGLLVERDPPGLMSQHPGQGQLSHDPRGRRLGRKSRDRAREGKEGRCQARAVAQSLLSAHLLLIEGHAAGGPGGPGTLHLRRKQKRERTLPVGLTSLGKDQTPLSPPVASRAMRTGFPSFCGHPQLSPFS